LTFSRGCFVVDVLYRRVDRVLSVLTVGVCL